MNKTSIELAYKPVPGGKMPFCMGFGTPFGRESLVTTQCLNVLTGPTDPHMLGQVVVPYLTNVWVRFAATWVWACEPVVQNRRLWQLVPCRYLFAGLV